MRADIISYKERLYEKITLKKIRVLKKIRAELRATSQSDHRIYGPDPQVIRPFRSQIHSDPTYPGRFLLFYPPLIKSGVSIVYFVKNPEKHKKAEIRPKPQKWQKIRKIRKNEILYKSGQNPP